MHIYDLIIFSFDISWVKMCRLLTYNPQMDLASQVSPHLLSSTAHQIRLDNQGGCHTVGTDRCTSYHLGKVLRSMHKLKRKNLQ